MQLLTIIIVFRWIITKLSLWNQYVHVFGDETTHYGEKCPIIIACGLHVKTFHGKP